MGYRAPGAAIDLAIGAHTSAGACRIRNEDAFLVTDLGRRASLGPDEIGARLEGVGFALGVYDGCGGSHLGPCPSLVAAAAVHEVLCAKPPPAAAGELAARLDEAHAAAARRVFEHVGRPGGGMGTTLTVASIVDDHLHLVHTGNSRAYLLRGDRLVQATRDDTLAADLTLRREIDPGELEGLPLAHILTRALGASAALDPGRFTIDLRRGDVLLLCTDGLHAQIDDGAIQATLRDHPDPLAAARALAGAADLAGGRDNATALIALFDGDWLRPPSPGDVLDDFSLARAG